MNDVQPETGEPPRRRRAWPWGWAVGLSALLIFGHDLGGEPHFADESAFFSQSYFADLWLEGRWDDARWLELPAYDLPPLPKYLIGASLFAGGYPRPGPASMWAWYDNIHHRPESPAMLVAGRWPSVVLGALGCVSVYALGVLAADRRTGVLAAALLMIDPLYRIHARRAMADVPAEALILLTAAVGLWSWREALARGRWALPGLAGVFGGLAVLAKLNGGLGLMILGAWALLAATLRRFGWRRATVAGLTGLSAVSAFVTFVALNPFVTARPDRWLPPDLARIAERDLWGRLRFLLDHRFGVSSGQQAIFPTYALRTPREKAEAVAIQGFGRFGPFGPGRDDSTRRFDWNQDGGALIWAPWVALGSIWAALRGRRQYRMGRPPTAWAVLILYLVALVTVTAYLPLAWDRYYLSIQPGAALLAAGVAVESGDRVGRLVRGRREARPS